ncbi:MAG: 2-amino-4-hydroxy-6-hydroxymethyldihydropteridine diphosphokinase [Bacteroidales bacterium]|nr:2-amino-4-hydroxy-6-hydroxymethyldihydropteridine diphosphokinase [Bacteroidales bacterium]
MEHHSVHTVWIGLGANLGDRRKSLVSALDRLKDSGCNVLTVSGIYENEAWGYQSTHMFYNQSAVLETAQLPGELLTMLKKTEKEMGRGGPACGFADRIIDLDILFYDDIIMDTATLKIPHPGIPFRAFVLKPLAEIAPRKVHPVLGLTVSELEAELNDPCAIRRLD